MKTIRSKLTAALIVVSLGIATVRGQEPVVSADPLQQRVPSITLGNQDVIDGAAILSQNIGLAVSVEHELGVSMSDAAHQPRVFNTTVGPGTVSEILDGLCTLDQTFTWKRTGNMINLLPRSVANDPSYLLNRKIDDLRFQDVREADDAVMKMVDQLSGTREQVAVMEVGTSLAFTRPWSTAVHNVTVREALNLIASQLGPTYGWQFSGARDFRIVIFHQRILPKHGRNEDTPRP
jgi:hypothetical protein